MTLEENYKRDLADMLAAAREWASTHPSPRLKFRRMSTSRDVVVIGPLSARVIRQVAGNSETRELLRIMDRAATRGGGGTVLQAEAVIDEVFGIHRALTEALSS